MGFDEFGDNGFKEPLIQSDSKNNCVLEIKSFDAGDFMKYFKITQTNSRFYVDLVLTLDELVKKQKISPVVKDAWSKNKNLMALKLSSSKFFTYITKTESYYSLLSSSEKGFKFYSGSKYVKFNVVFSSINAVAGLTLMLTAIWTRDLETGFFDESNRLANGCGFGAIISFVNIGLAQLFCSPDCAFKSIRQSIRSECMKTEMEKYVKNLYLNHISFKDIGLILNDNCHLIDDVNGIIQDYYLDDYNPSPRLS